MHACRSTLEDPTLRPARSFREYEGRARFHAANRCVPPLVEVLPDLRVTVARWCEGVAAESTEALGQVVSAWLPRFRAYAPPAPEDVAAVVTALKRFAAEPGEAALATADTAAAALNASTVGGVHRFQQTHPQVELLRIRNHLHEGAWALSAAAASHLDALLTQVLLAGPLVVPAPALCHGSVKPAHVLRGDAGLVLCDYDGSRYVFGPFDEAYCLFDQLWHRGASLGSVAAALRAWLPGVRRRLLGVAWFVVDLAFFGVLLPLCSGKDEGLRRFVALAPALSTEVSGLLGNHEARAGGDDLAVLAEEALDLP